MQPDFIPLAIPDLGGREAEYLQKCVTDNFVSSVGPFVTAFEESVARAVGGKHGVSTASGTAGLHLALVTIGVRHDDLVLCPSFTFIASANAISHAGATPWFVDIDSASWTMNPAALRHLLETETERRSGELVHIATGRRVAAILPVHTLGTTADIEPIAAIAAEFSLPIVADAACAIGVRYRGQAITDFADLSVFSFNGNKTITCGGGGMIVGNDDTLLKRAKHLCTTARVGRDYDHDEVGFNYRMTNIEAAVGLAQIERLDHFIARKREIRRRYEDAFAPINWLNRFPAPDWADSACWLSGIVVGDGAPHSVAEIVAALQAEKIDARPFWKPAHLQKPYRSAPVGAMVHTDEIWHRIITLPSSTGLTEADQDRVIACVLNLR